MKILCAPTLCWKVIDLESRVFTRLFTHGGTSAGGQSVNGGTHEGGHRPNFDRLYHTLKVLLLLSCNYTMQFIGYDCIKTQ